MAIYNIYNLYIEYKEATGDANKLKPTEEEYCRTIKDLLKISSIRKQIPAFISDEYIYTRAFIDTNNKQDTFYRWDYWATDIEDGIEKYEKKSIRVHYNVPIKPNRVFIGGL